MTPVALRILQHNYLEPEAHNDIGTFFADDTVLAVEQEIKVDDTTVFFPLATFSFLLKDPKGVHSVRVAGLPETHRDEGFKILGVLSNDKGKMALLWSILDLIDIPQKSMALLVSDTFAILTPKYTPYPSPPVVDILTYQSLLVLKKDLSQHDTMRAIARASTLLRGYHAATSLTPNPTNTDELCFEPVFLSP
jgi:hypothetical protein